MPELVEWINKEIDKGETHPVYLAAQFHYRYIKIHPFDDGNGRIARLLINLILMKSKLPPIVIKETNRNEYLNALQEADRGNDELFINFIGSRLIESLELLHQVVRNIDINEDNDLDKRIKLFTKKMEDRFMHINETPKIRVDVIKNVYKPLIFSVNDKIKKIQHLFSSSSWYYFEEPKPPKYLTSLLPLRGELVNILTMFQGIAERSSSSHNFKVMCWMTNFRDKDNPFNCELAFKLHFYDFHFELYVFYGSPQESGFLFETFKQIMETIDNDRTNQKFQGYRYKLLERNYDDLPDDLIINKTVDECVKRLMDYIEKMSEF